MENSTLEAMQKLLDNCGVLWEPVNESYGFYREIKFKVYGREFRIEWYKNLSHIRVGADPRSPVYPFRYLTLDECYPLVKQNRSLCFAYDTEKKIIGVDRNLHTHPSEFLWRLRRLPMTKPDGSFYLGQYWFNSVQSG